MAEDMCRTSEVTEITPPGIGAVVLKELPAAGKEGIVYVIEGNPITTYIWDGDEFVQLGGGGGMPDFFIAPSSTTYDGVNYLSFGTRNEGEQCSVFVNFIGGILDSFYANGRWYGNAEIWEMAFANEITFALDGFNSYDVDNEPVASMSIDCDDPAYASGQTITRTLTVTFDGVAHTQQIPITIVG